MRIKFAAVAMALVFVMGITATGTLAVRYEDVAGESYEEAVNVISELGIMEGESKDTFLPEGGVSRAEMVTTILKFLNIEHMATGTDEQIFKDVSKIHRAYKNIHTAYAMGLINGVSSDEFAPDIPITFPQAVKIIVTALGYDVKAEGLGGYPSGYLAAAAQAGILKGVSAAGDNALTRHALAQMLYRALDVELFERTQYGGDSHTYETQEGVTPLTKYLNYNTISGVITATNKTGLFSSASTLREDEVVIANKTFKAGNTGAEEYLGYFVRAYYTTAENSDDNIIKFFYTDSKNKVLTLSDEDDMEFDYSGGSFHITYYNEEKNRQEKIVAAASACIYNGKAVDLADVEADVIPRLQNFETGSVTLIDHTGGSNYNVVFIQQYVSMMVDRVNDINQTISCVSYTPTGNTITNLIKLSDDVMDISYNIFNAKGSPIELNQIARNNVISVYSSIDESVFDIYVSEKRIAGDITEVTNNEKYAINGKTYKRISSLPGELLTLGMSSIFYLDRDEHIVGVDIDSVLTGKYGFLMGVYIPTDNGLSSFPSYKILTDDGEMKNFESERRIIAYNPASGDVEKVDVSELVYTQRTQKGYGSGYEHMLWYTQNQNNFTYETSNAQTGVEFYYRPWLTIQDRSDIASRKPVYYETDAKGKITKIIVPDIPVAGQNKLTTINPERNNFMYMSAGRKMRDPSAGTATAPTPFVNISQNALIISVLALDYTDKDYKVSTGGTAIFRNENNHKVKM